MKIHIPAKTLPWLDGTQRIYRFPNGYGASVLNGTRGSYGQELAVIRFRSESLDDFDLVYDTPVTDDVLGWLTDEALAENLDQIAALPNPAEVSA